MGEQEQDTSESDADEGMPVTDESKNVMLFSDTMFTALQKHQTKKQELVYGGFGPNGELTRGAYDTPGPDVAKAGEAPSSIEDTQTSGVEQSPSFDDTLTIKLPMNESIEQSVEEPVEMPVPSQTNKQVAFEDSQAFDRASTVRQ